MQTCSRILHAQSIVQEGYVTDIWTVDTAELDLNVGCENSAVASGDGSQLSVMSRREAADACNQGRTSQQLINNNSFHR
jgi:hypothetical protein